MNPTACSALWSEWTVMDGDVTRHLFSRLDWTQSCTCLANTVSTWYVCHPQDHSIMAWGTATRLNLCQDFKMQLISTLWRLHWAILLSDQYQYEWRSFVHCTPILVRHGQYKWLSYDLTFSKRVTNCHGGRLHTPKSIESDNHVL